MMANSNSDRTLVQSSQMPYLPPINDKLSVDPDRWKKSKLMNYRRENEERKVLDHIIMQRAKKRRVELQELMETEPPQLPPPEYPTEMMSRDRKIKMNYLYLKTCVESTDIPQLQLEIIENIKKMVPDKLKTLASYAILEKEVSEEICSDFDKSMRKALG